jgi:hypothetical protein
VLRGIDVSIEEEISVIDINVAVDPSMFAENVESVRVIGGVVKEYLF